MVVHIIGAFSAFISFIVYTFIDIFLARKLRNFMYGSLRFTIVRLIICSIAAVNLILGKFLVNRLIIIANSNKLLTIVLKVAVFTYVYFILSSEWSIIEVFINLNILV